MTVPSALLSALALAFYIPASVCYAALLFLRVPAAGPSTGPHSPLRASRAGLILLLLGMTAQFAAIGAWCLLIHRSPFASEYGTLTVLAWIIAFAVAVCDVRFRLPAVAALALPISCLVLFVGMLYLRAPVADTALLKSRIVSLHVISILGSYALFALAFGCAGLYLLQNRLLKSRRPAGALRRLPPLVTLDSVAYHAVAYAMPLLTIGLALGVAYIYNGAVKTPPASWFTDAHNIVAFATWLLYVVYLSARLGLGWQGVRLQYILVAGLALTVLLYLVPSNSHRFTTPQPTYRNPRY
jgi:ABC-type transport system involved in cytochrome c biogenesis permease subunit